MSAYRVPAVVSTMRLLSLLASEGGQSASQTELARDAELSKSTTHSLLATLEEGGYVQRDPSSLRYRLGPSLIRLGAVAARQTRAIAIAIEQLAARPAELKVSIGLAQPTTDGGAQVIEVFYPPNDMHVGMSVGARFGPFDGAIGKCILAGMEPDAMRRLVAEGDITRWTSNTVVNRRELLREVERVRERGWATSVQEYNENNAVVAPVFDAAGRPELYILAVAFVSQLPDGATDELGAQLREIADRIRFEATGLEVAATR